MVCSSGGSKSRLSKAAGAEPSGQMRDEKCMALWPQTHFEVKKCAKHVSVGAPLWREAHVEVKVYKARQHAPTSDHYWKLRCQKSARDCGAKHLLKSRRVEHTILGSLLDVQAGTRVSPSQK